MPDIEKVTRQLQAMLLSERRQAMWYTILTVLCTPAFVMIACAAMVILVCWLFWDRWYELDNIAFFTGMNVMLAGVLVAAARPYDIAQGRFPFDGAWVAGAILFLLLLLLSYGTALPQQRPGLLSLVYGVGCFLTLGLLARGRLPDHTGETVGYPVIASAQAVADFVMGAYAELFSASWLWFPPSPQEIRIGARVLHHLATDRDGSLGENVVEKRIAALLQRLKLIESVEQRVSLTSKGFDFLRTTETGN